MDRSRSFYFEPAKSHRNGIPVKPRAARYSGKVRWFYAVIHLVYAQPGFKGGDGSRRHCEEERNHTGNNTANETIRRQRSRSTGPTSITMQYRDVYRPSGPLGKITEAGGVGAIRTPLPHGPTQATKFAWGEIETRICLKWENLCLGRDTFCLTMAIWSLLRVV